MTQKTFAQALREARGDQEIIEFAKKIGFSKNSVIKWEKGHLPSHQTIDEISNALQWGNRKRNKINYPLIYKLDKKYGDLSGGGPQNAPEDDPDLLQLQREMNRKW